MYVWKDTRENTKALVFAESKEKAWSRLCKEWDLTLQEEKDDLVYKDSFKVKNGEVINFFY